MTDRQGGHWASCRVWLGLCILGVSSGRFVFMPVKCAGEAVVRSRFVSVAICTILVQAQKRANCLGGESDIGAETKVPT